MLLPRLITAVIGIPLVVLTVYWGGIPFFIMMLGIVFLALREYFVLCKMKYQALPATGIACGIAVFISLFLNGTRIGTLADNQGTPAVISILFVVIVLVEMLRRNPSRSIERLAITVFGIMFIPWTLGHLLLIRSLRPGGMEYVFFLFITIWSLDTGAYFTGKKLGRRPLASTISPKKTLEGAAGGVVTGMITAVICRGLFMKDILSAGEALFLGLGIAVVSQMSDLAESLLKRDAGVKDSAHLLPGHGGMLDRFDSFLLTAPLFYYYLTIVNHY